MSYQLLLGSQEKEVVVMCSVLGSDGLLGPF